ncbi:transcriptional regulator with PAS, ATPase and Fis domain [Anaerosolibacter carboniphilus]|uniref:Transcriptional regulator with PAS, ATPase and Fis domain n=1 Tax=Anaerosolibacter carboniphilus TaxID=1417629 RepID=A0A841KUG1_9FIRM|nr:sigma 54-interacting transcriptional regulator [Anaerosolibacter carboniphilus]MBB6217071.1 transcriptional regulator with PAS, ATPase and Fis domain [Anaerosolibacter carboniphilus]
MNLMRITASVQKIAEVIASVINVDVTIVDCELNRIAATGCYGDHIGTKVSRNSVFGFALRQGEGFIIDNPRNHMACKQCEDQHQCKEHAQVCCPIKVYHETVGVIGLIAFEETQKKSIVNNQENLMAFLHRMADLIASKLMEEEKTEKIKLLARELEIVLDAVDRGIIAVDAVGKIMHFNLKAAQLFRLDEKSVIHRNIDEILGEIDFYDLKMRNISIKNREFSYKKGAYRVRGIYGINPIIVGMDTVGYVFTFSNISEALNVVNDVIGSAIETKFHHIIGESEGMARAKEEAQKAAESPSTILIQGESGTGKELFARAIHFQGSRRRRPFIPINCAAIPEQLLESELFGYEEGAFTGAKRGGKAGKFELANKGTIFLDEIGDMPLHLQAKLLRVLQENVIEKIGGREYIPIDVRIIAATNKNLEQKVMEGEFRKDLYYRLNVIPLNIPSLRDRMEDVDILVGNLLRKCNHKLGKRVEGIQTGALRILQNYQWPGNVRELENTIEYAVNMCSQNQISEEDLPKRLKNRENQEQSNADTRVMTIRELEYREIEKALKLCEGSKQSMDKAAELLGLSRATLYRKLKEYQLKQSQSETNVSF